MVAFGFATAAHNPYLGFHGDFDVASRACFRTAAVFGVLGALSLVAFVLSAIRSKFSPEPSARGDYHAV